MPDDASSLAKAKNFKMRKVLIQITKLDPKGEDFEAQFGMIRERAKQLLKDGAARAGNPVSLKANRDKALAARLAKKEEREAVLRPLIAQLRNEGLSSLRQIADRLTAMGHAPPRGGKWHPHRISRIEHTDAQN